jgi:hypothetical protein
MQSQIEYELDILKNGNYDHARQFIEHLVNVLTRTSTAASNNANEINTIEQQKDDIFWGYTFNFISKVVDFELDAMYAVTYRNNQITLLFNPTKIEDDYTVETMLDGLRHEGYHLLFNHLNVHKNLDNHLSNLAADCEINQHLEKPHEHWISREYIAKLCELEEYRVDKKAGSLYYYELLNQHRPPEKHNQPNGMCSAKPWQEAEVGKNGNYIPVDVTIKSVFDNAMSQAKQRGALTEHIEDAIANLNKPPQVKWQNEVQKKMGRHITSQRPSPNRLYRRDPMALHRQGMLSDQAMPIVFAHDISGSVSKAETEVFMNELYQIIKRLHMPITHIQFDSNIVNVNEIDGSNPKTIDFTRYGCGGTTFQSIFDYLKENKFPRETQIFIFTDGGGESSINTHGYKNYTWLLTDENHLSVKNNRNKIIHIKSK